MIFQECQSCGSAAEHDAIVPAVVCLLSLFEMYFDFLGSFSMSQLFHIFFPLDGALFPFFAEFPSKTICPQKGV